MDPSAKAPLGSQLPDQGEDTRKRKRESEDPEEPRKRSRETLRFSQGPSQRTLEDSVKRGNKRRREDSEEDDHGKKIKLSPSQGEDLDSAGQQSEGPIIISSSSSSCFSKEKRCGCIVIDDSSSDGQNCSNAAVADPSGRQGAESEIVIISSRDSSCAEDQANASPPCEGTSSSNLVTEVKSSDHYSKVEFEAKYTKEMKIGQGAFGSVFAGYRNSDHLPSIIQQLVDAFVEIHSRGVLHRDLHLENVLMELGSTVPRARVIDFGFGRFTKSCQPLTVYQIGKVLRDLIEYSPDSKFTKHCNDFLSACLESEDESSVQGLKRHPWLKQMLPASRLVTG